MPRARMPSPPPRPRSHYMDDEWAECEHCSDGLVICPKCHGEKTQECENCSPDDECDHKGCDCSECDGEGYVGECPHCDGKGGHTVKEMREQAWENACEDRYDSWKCGDYDNDDEYDDK